jgi:ABC-type polar amino acid transport system ATPase subunit
MSAIEVKNLVKKFHGQTVLHGIDLEVKPGEVVAIIGPSGSGKTTLLRSINLLEQPEAGTITVGDITIDTARSLSQQKSLIRQLRQHVGFVFQNFNLFPHRTVLENIIEGPVARLEGILLDPVYTGKAMAGLIDGISQKRFKDEGPILFIHTGGAPALFAYHPHV